jgi:hypothetical protein
LKCGREKNVQLFSNHLKLASFAMDANKPQMASCVLIHSLPGEHYNTWILTWSMGWDECKHDEGGLWLRDGIVQIKFIRWWKILLMISETLIGVVKLWTRCLSLGLSTKGCELNGC